MQFPIDSTVQFTMKMRRGYRTRKAIVITEPTASGWFNVRDKRSNIIFAIHPEQHRVKAVQA
jgi:hypothetical protein